MLPTLVVITGQFRSGTSAVAQIVNRLGIPVAVTMGVPHAFSHYELDWEDPQTYETLDRWRPVSGRAVDLHGFVKAIRADLERRLYYARFLADRAFLPPPLAIATKCPLWALALQELGEAVDGLFGDVTLVRTTREQGAIDRSVERVYKPAFRPHVYRTNLLIQRELEAGHAWDLVVDYDELVRNPECRVAEIAAALTKPWSPADAASAAAMIRRAA